MSKLSVVISAYNEEKKIKDCLESIKWVDEIIFLNNSSTDRTVEIAKQYTKTIINQKNDPLSIDLQKNFGIEKASGDWILILDADERVTSELAGEIQKHLESRDSDLVTGYWIPRKNIIFGKWIEHTGWYPDAQLRLFRKGCGKFTQKHVHEPLHIEGKTEKLNEHLLHENYDSIAQFLSKTMNIYAPNEAEEKLKQGYLFEWRDAIRFPLREFLSRYFAREGYKDGFHGLMLSFFMAFYHFVIFAMLWEKKGFTQVEKQGIASLQDGLENEFEHVKKEVTFWLYNEKIKEEKNPVKKIFLKGKRRL